MKIRCKRITFSFVKNNFSKQNCTKKSRNTCIRAFHMYTEFDIPRVIFKPSILVYQKNKMESSRWGGFFVGRLMTGYS